MMLIQIDNIVREMTPEEETEMEEWRRNTPRPDIEAESANKAEAYDIIVSGINSKGTPKPLEIAKKIKELVEKYYKG